jgi:NitT/TauT family transport system permease protein
MIWLLRILLFAGLLLLWELASGPLFDLHFLSKPSAIVAEFWALAASGRLTHHAGITIVEALSGFAAGGFVGMASGIVLGRNKLLSDVLDPLITAFYSLPKVALAPLFVLWFGIGIEMKIILTATIVFFLVFLNTYTGVRNTSAEQIAILKLMGASGRQVLSKVVIPSALTWVFAGLRLSVPYALIGAIVGELIAANRGLGYLLSNAAGQFNTAGVFAAIVAIVLVSAALNIAVRLLEDWFMPWQRHGATREVSI